MCANISKGVLAVAILSAKGGGFRGSASALQVGGSGFEGHAATTVLGLSSERGSGVLESKWFRRSGW
jgi:hypothetical protein